MIARTPIAQTLSSGALWLRFEWLASVLGIDSYFGITSRASLLITTSRRSLRFFPASIMASREP